MVTVDNIRSRAEALTSNIANANSTDTAANFKADVDALWTDIRSLIPADTEESATRAEAMQLLNSHSVTKESWESYGKSFLREGTATRVAVGAAALTTAYALFHAYQNGPMATLSAFGDQVWNLPSLPGRAVSFVWEGAGTALSSTGSALSSAASTVGEALSSAGSTVSSAFGSAGSTITSIPGSISDTVSGAFSSVRSGFSSAADKVQSAFSSVSFSMPSVSSPFVWAKDSVGNVWSSVFGSSTATKLGQCATDLAQCHANTAATGAAAQTLQGKLSVCESALSSLGTTKQEVVDAVHKGVSKAVKALTGAKDSFTQATATLGTAQSSLTDAARALTGAKDGFTQATATLGTAHSSFMDSSTRLATLTQNVMTQATATLGTAQSSVTDAANALTAAKDGFTQATSAAQTSCTATESALQAAKTLKNGLLGLFVKGYNPDAVATAVQQQLQAAQF